MAALPPGFSITQISNGNAVQTTVPAAGGGIPTAAFPPPTGWQFTLTNGTTTATGMNGTWSTNSATNSPNYVAAPGSWTLTANCNGVAATPVWNGSQVTFTTAATGGASAQSCTVAIALVSGVPVVSGNNLQFTVGDGETATIPAPGWNFVIWGTGITGALNGAAYCWQPNGGAQLSLTGMGNWTLTGTFNGVAANPQINSTNTQVTFTSGSTTFIIYVGASGPAGSTSFTRIKGSMVIQNNNDQGAATVQAPQTWIFYMADSTTPTVTYASTGNGTWQQNGVSLGQESLSVSTGSWNLGASYNLIQQGLSVSNGNVVTVGSGTNAITSNITCTPGG